MKSIKTNLNSPKGSDKGNIVSKLYYIYYLQRGPGGSMSYVVGLLSNSYKPITNMCGFVPGFVHYKMGALDSQPQVIKLTSCLPMVGGSQSINQYY
jgi:hypothetical protein